MTVDILGAQWTLEERAEADDARLSEWKWRMTRTEFENKELAEFLEDAVRGLVEFDPTKIAIVANNCNTGFAQTQYYNCSIVDKGCAITQILQDIIDDFIVSNRDRIRAILMDDEIDGRDDEVE